MTSSLRKAKLDYFQRELDGCKGDPKSFWKLMKNVLPPNNQSTKVGKLVVDGVDITDSKGICDSLNSYFTSIAKDLLSTRNSKSALLASNPQYETISTPTLQSPTSNSVLHFRPTTDEEIFRMLANLKPNKATGHDNIPAKVLKIAAGLISQSLSCVINSSLETGIFPDRWKTAKISYFSKGSNRNNRDNYRPISILPCLSKICESCVNNRLQEYDMEF